MWKWGRKTHAHLRQLRGKKYHLLAREKKHQKQNIMIIIIIISSVYCYKLDFVLFISSISMG